jgi:hypothetical protein
MFNMVMFLMFNNTGAMREENGHGREEVSQSTRPRQYLSGQISRASLRAFPTNSLNKL